MPSDEDADVLLRAHSRALIVVGAVILLAAMYFSLSWLSEEHVLTTAPELAWSSSQRPSASTASQPLGDETTVTLTRSMCFGDCPAYEVMLFGSGRVEFRGESSVCEKSPPATQADPELVRRLVAGLVTTGFQTMPHYTRQDWTDHPTVTVTLKQGGTAHTVEHYHGDTSAPHVLSMMEDRIDEVAGTAAWIGVQQGAQRVCVRPDGTRKPIEFR